MTVHRWPVSSSCCRAWRARSRASARRRWAAATRWWLLSRRIGGVLLATCFGVCCGALAVGLVGFEGGDDGEQVGFDRAVHLGQAGVAVGLSTRDQRAGVVELLAVLGQEFGGRDEQRTSQTCVGVRARFL